MWATSTRHVRHGSVVRLQCNALAAPILARLLGPALPPSDRQTETTTISVRIEPEVTRGVQPLHVLYLDGCLHVRSHDHTRVLGAVLDLLDVGADTGDELLVLDGFALVRNEVATLLPAGIRSHVVAVERRLNRAGLRLTDGEQVLIDPASGNLVVPRERRPPVPPVEGAYAGTEAGRAPAGSWRVRAWLLDDLAGANDPRRQPGVELVRNLQVLRPWRARAILTKVELGASLVRTWDPWPDDLVGALDALASGQR